MKILDVVSFLPVKDGTGQPWWEASEKVLGDSEPGVYGHSHQFHHTCVEWRIAEYAMDPADLDSVLHLILHEVTLSRRTEINCWTPGYDQQGALRARLAQIQVNIDRHAARMDASHHQMAKHPAHKHPALDPIREQGVRDELLHPRRLFIDGLRAKRAGRKSYGSDKLREAHALLTQEERLKHG